MDETQRRAAAAAGEEEEATTWDFVTNAERFNRRRRRRSDEELTATTRVVTRSNLQQQQQFVTKGWSSPVERVITKEAAALAAKTGRLYTWFGGERTFGPPIQATWPQQLFQLHPHNVRREQPERVDEEEEYERELYLRNVPADATEVELVPILEVAGPVVLLRTFTNSAGGNTGEAFVLYATGAEAVRSAQLLQGFPIRQEVSLEVAPATDHRRVIIWGRRSQLMLGTTTGRQLFERLRRDLVWGLERLDISDEGYDYCYEDPVLSLALTFSSNRSAGIGMAALLSRQEYSGGVVRIDWAEQNNPFLQNCPCSPGCKFSPVLRVKNLPDPPKMGTKDLHNTFDNQTNGGVTAYARARGTFWVQFRQSPEEATALVFHNPVVARFLSVQRQKSKGCTVVVEWTDAQFIPAYRAKRGCYQFWKKQNEN